MKTALLGCGRVAEHYRKMLLEIDPVDSLEVIAVCDLDNQKADFMAKAFGCNAYSSAEQMLALETMDVLLILTPSGNHYEHAIMALKAGVNVVCEKPVTMTPEEAIELQKIADENSLFCCTVFQNRWNPALLAAKKAVEQGRLKKIVTLNIRLQWCRYQEYYQDGWHGTWALDGGVINQQAIHHIDALQWIGGPIDAVCASSANRMNELEAEDTLVAIVRFKNGALATIEATTAARPKDFEASLSIVGEGGKIQIGGVALNKIDEWTFVEEVSGDIDAIENNSMEVPSGYGLSHSPYLRDLVSAFNNNTMPEVTIQSAEITLRLVHALYASCETNAWVKLDDEPRSKFLGIK